MRQINLNSEISKICDFIKKQLGKAHKDKIIIGLSGGIDSALVAALCVKAIGKENVIGVMLPYKNSHPNSLNDALEVSDKFEINHKIIDISPMVDAYFDNYCKNADSLRRGNRQARERMCVLFDLSAKYNGLVVGTGNKSELLVGYMTQHGDGACAFEPIGHLYKTEVKAMAELLEVPKSIIEKAPTADLWNGQTDEQEMGISYSELDEILYNLIDKKFSKTELTNSEFDESKVDKVLGMIKRSAFKRQMPPSLEDVWDC